MTDSTNIVCSLIRTYKDYITASVSDIEERVSFTLTPSKL